MERVAFIIEDTGERIGCQLNPEGFALRRQAGITARRSPSGTVTGAGLADDPLHFTGGGRTEFDLDLLFDTTLPTGSTSTPEDVRELTAPLWRLSENAASDGRYGRPPVVRLVWGKAWNIPGVVTAVAERFEAFTPAGIPRRSWLRLRMRRVNEPPIPKPAAPPPLELPERPDVLEPPPAPDGIGSGGGSAGGPGTAGGGPGVVTTGERIDELAARLLGDSARWRLLAYANDLLDPLRVEPGTELVLPDFEPGGPTP